MHEAVLIWFLEAQRSCLVGGQRVHRGGRTFCQSLSFHGSQQKGELLSDMKLTVNILC